MTIRLVLSDDHTILRVALRELLARESDLEVVGEAGTGAETVEVVARTLPDVLVVDIAMPDVNGVEITRRVRACAPDVKILALSGHADRRFVQAMIRAGACGYMVKSDTGTELVQAIRSIAAGNSYLSVEVTDVLLTELRSPGTAGPGPDVLGRRELQVLRLVAEGKRTAAIAAELHISPATVETHRRNIMRKLDLHSAPELTKFAIREGLISA